MLSVFKGGNFFESVSAFINYALGMGFLLVIVTLGVVFFKTAMIRITRSVVPYVQPAGAIFLVLAGFYLIYYWTIGTGSEVLF